LRVGWSIQVLREGSLFLPLQGNILSVAMTTDASNDHVLRVTFSGVGSISRMSPLQLLLFDVTTVGAVQPASVGIQSAILNSFGSTIATDLKEAFTALSHPLWASHRPL